MELLKSQKADVFQVLKSAGLDPRLITWTTMGHHSGIGQVPAIQVRDTAFFFAFSDHFGRPVVYQSPGRETQSAYLRCENWTGVIYHLGTWAALVNRELNASDPWAELEEQEFPINVDPRDPNADTPFDANELKAVTAGLHRLEELFLEFAGKNKAQQKAIRQGIKRLETSASKTDRMTFFYTVAGFIASTAVSMALAPDQTKTLFECLRRTFEGALRLIGG